MGLSNDTIYNKSVRLIWVKIKCELYNINISE
jgi:hypothetical protein